MYAVTMRHKERLFEKGSPYEQGGNPWLKSVNAEELSIVKGVQNEDSQKT